MKLKSVCLVLFFDLFFLLLSEITCITYNQEENLISEEDRRAADSFEKTDHSRSEASKRGLYEPSGTPNRHQSYQSGYGDYSSHGYSYYPVHTYVPSYYPSHSYGPPSGHGGGYAASAQGHSSHSALALKGLLIPLAGIALLGAAAALSTNPVLLQLGVVNGRRRRRRSTGAYPVNSLTKSRKK